MRSAPRAAQPDRPLAGIIWCNNRLLRSWRKTGLFEDTSQPDTVGRTATVERHHAIADRAAGLPLDAGGVTWSGPRTVSSAVSLKATNASNSSEGSPSSIAL